MRTAFWIGVGWLAYVYFGYPLLLALAGLWRRVHPAAADSALPRVSVLIAARNEEKDIGWKIAETLAWDYPEDRLDILVASDASEDSTDEIVRSIGGPRVFFTRMQRRGGKNRALNHLSEMARGEILFFTDANAHIKPETLRRMVRHFADPRVGCVTGTTHPIEEIDNPAVSLGSGVYWNYESTLKRLENRIGSVLVCDGAIFCSRAALFQPLCPDLSNDLDVPMRVGAAGYWVLDDPLAYAYERDTSSPAEEFTRRRRMTGLGMAAIFELPGIFSGLRGWQFLSHKLLRWLSAIPMLLILGASAALVREPVFAALVVLQGAFYLMAAGGLACAVARRPIGRLFAVPFYIVLGVAGALVGVVESLFGKRFGVWEIPTLSRGPVGMPFPGAKEGGPSGSCPK